jgi:NAD+ synthase (glutamine-hydrolysing)
MKAFDSLYSHGMVRVAVGTPQVELCSPAANARRTFELARSAAAASSILTLFPELGLSGYSNDDLLQQDALLDAVEAAAGSLIEDSTDIQTVLIIGAPLRSGARLYNCALIIHRGRLLGVVPKTYLPNYREFYERRQFSSATQALESAICVAGHTAPFGADLLFEATDCTDFVLHVEICEDLWVPLPPSTLAAMGGATVLANLSASDVTIGKAAYRRGLCASQSAKCVAAYLYAAAGYGESSTDLAWDGHAIIAENGEIVAESERFRYRDGWIRADLDLERLRQERMRMNSFNECVQLHRPRLQSLQRIRFELQPPAVTVALERVISRFPYVPAEPEVLAERCREVYEIQTQALVRRLQATGLQRPVLGLSAGLDSTQALLVAVRAVDRLQLPRTCVLAYALPGPASTERSQQIAARLAAVLGVQFATIDIRPSVMQMLKDIDHPVAHGEQLYDLTFENVQAGERSSHLFRLANLHHGLVVGTSDLSELALGYTTYGVGDQMAHYAVNASVPKTLLRHLLHWLVGSDELQASAKEVISEVLAAPSSPELLPTTAGAAPQSAEAAVGPYALQDFNLYYLSRYGFRPSKVAFLAQHAWSDRARGPWPQTVPQSERVDYDLVTICHWLRLFLQRFFEASQFKRSALPNGPKIGSGGALSPRGDWRAPSDVSAGVWLEELDRSCHRAAVDRCDYSA